MDKKESQHDNLFDEIMRERAAVLSRLGKALGDTLETLNALEKDIQRKMRIFEEKKQNLGDHFAMSTRKKLCAEINSVIDQFNLTRRKAQLKYYYFIVTREAMGLRHHERVFEIYKLPDKKEKIQDAD